MKKISTYKHMLTSLMLIAFILIAVVNCSKKEDELATNKITEPTYSKKTLLPSEVFGQHKKNVTQTNNIEKK